MPDVDAPAAHPCPCCGHLTLSGPPGSHEICPVCFWEDDVMQLRWPTYARGANRPCLVDSQLAYVQLGAMERRFLERVRRAADDEPLDTGWRPVDLVHDSFEAEGDREAEWPDDRTTLYWWRPTFWRSTRSGHT